MAVNLARHARLGAALPRPAADKLTARVLSAAFRAAGAGEGEPAAHARVAALHIAKAALRSGFRTGAVVRDALRFVARRSEAGGDPQAMVLRARELEAEGEVARARDMYRAAQGHVARGEWRAEDAAREVVNAADLQFQHGSLLLRAAEGEAERGEALAMLRAAALDGGHYEASLALGRQAGGAAAAPDGDVLAKLAASGHAQAAAQLGEWYARPRSGDAWIAGLLDRSVLGARGLSALDALARTMAWRSANGKKRGDAASEVRSATRRRELEKRLEAVGGRSGRDRNMSNFLALDWFFLAAILGDASACQKGVDLAYRLGLPSEVFLFYALMHRRKSMGASVKYSAPKTDESAIAFVLGRDVYLWFAALLERRGADDALLVSVEKLIGFLGTGFKDTVDSIRRLERRSS
jgi:hypothetical protein